MSGGGPRLVILDRDGVINRESDAFIKSPDEWVPLPGAPEAIAALGRAGYTVVVATNQSGLARGLFDAPTLEAIHERMRATIAAAGGRIDGIFVCPHGPADGCDCRKPRPGLFRQIESAYGTSVAGVAAIGDSARDLEAARAAGARPVLVLTGNGRKAAESEAAKGVETHADLAAAVRMLTGDKA